MAISRKGKGGKVSGKIGNVVTYTLYGAQVERSIGKRVAPVTGPELVNRQKTAITSAFLRPVHNFIQTGYELEAKRELKTQYSLVTSYIRLNAIAGAYPNQYVDCEKVLFSKGKMPAIAKPTVEKDDNGLVFTWDNSMLLTGIKDTDQVMLMAYVPERNACLYKLCAAVRKDGVAYLPIPKNGTSLIIETYFSFISENRKNIANSIYTGRLIW